MSGASGWSALDAVGFQTLRVLLAVLWQSSILIGAIALLAFGLRRRRAAVRHALWVAAVLVGPLLPLLTWGAARVGSPQAEIRVMPAHVEPAAEVPELPVAFDEGPEGGEHRPAPARDGAMPRAPVQPTVRLLDCPWAMGLIGYATGLAVVLSLVFVGLVRVRRWVRGGADVTDPRVLETFAAARGTFELARRVRVAECAGVRVPMTVRTVRPVVLLPAGFARAFSDAELRAVAIHELAHVKRNDALVLALVSLVRALLYFHPLVWWAAREIAALAEQTADDAVLDATAAPIPYAKMLARLAEQLPRRMPATELAVGILLTRGALLRRVQAILSDGRARVTRLSRRVLAATVLAAAASVALAAALPLGERGQADSRATHETDVVSANDEPTAPDLVRAVIDDENKTHDVRSMYLRIEGEWRGTQAGIAARLAELEQQFPDWNPEDFDPKRFPGLRLHSTETLELAFDGPRVRERHDRHDYSHMIRIWDGRKLLMYENYFHNDQEGFLFDGRRDRWPVSFLSHLSWLRVGAHDFRWSPWTMGPPGEFMRRNALRPEDYELLGRTVFRGHDCYVLETKAGMRRLHVGVADGRLYGYAWLGVSPQKLAEVQPDLFKKVAGRPIASKSEWNAWFRSLPTKEQDAAGRRYKLALAEFAEPSHQFYCDEYREIAPSLWFPMRQGTTRYLWQNAKRLVKAEHDLRVVEVKVNEAPPEALFTLELKEGVHVFDQRYEPPLSYTHKNKFSQQEWQAILEKQQQEAGELRKLTTLRDSRLGKSALDFPETTWFNSEPIRWEDLRGKVIILHFWAEWCAPCHNDLPNMEGLHKNREESGIVVIGVHTPGSRVDDISKVMQLFKLHYPICIDTAKPEGGVGFGHLGSWYGVNGIPYAVVVDQDGRVAAHGTLSTVLETAARLVRDRQKREQGIRGD